MADKDAELIEQTAELMGMKPREVIEVVEVDDGYAVRTHDGRWTSIVDGTVGGLYPVGYSPAPVKKPAAAAVKKG